MLFAFILTETEEGPEGTGRKLTTTPMQVFFFCKLLSVIAQSSARCVCAPHPYWSLCAARFPESYARRTLPPHHNSSGDHTHERIGHVRLLKPHRVDNETVRRAKVNILRVIPAGRLPTGRQTDRYRWEPAQWKLARTTIDVSQSTHGLKGRHTARIEAQRRG